MQCNAQLNLIEKLESGYALPSLSPVAIKLVELAADDTCSVPDLAKLIEKDPSLTVRLLSLANNAFYRALEPARTLRQAIVKIGFHRLRIMALSLSLRDTFPMGKVGSMDYEKFWRISLYRALIAKSLAKELKKCDPDEAFVGGLILEIGFLIFFQLFLQGNNDSLCLKMDRLDELLRSEKEQFGVDHRAIGAAALRHWNFPENIIQCQHLWGEAALDPKVSGFVLVCEMARGFSHALFQQSLWTKALFMEAEERFGLDHEIVSDIIIETFNQVEEIGRTIKLEINKQRDLLVTLEKANSALSRILEKISTVKQLTMPKSLPSFLELNKEGDKETIVTNTLQAVAHEIRNPILAVGGFAKKLTASLDPLSAESRLAKIILDEAQRLEKVFFEITRDFA
jgi:HD-like signal output (HDOD) protein